MFLFCLKPFICLSFHTLRGAKHSRVNHFHLWLVDQQQHQEQDAQMQYQPTRTLFANKLFGNNKDQFCSSSLLTETNRWCLASMPEASCSAVFSTANGYYKNKAFSGTSFRSITRTSQRGALQKARAIASAKVVRDDSRPFLRTENVFFGMCSTGQLVTFFCRKALYRPKVGSSLVRVSQAIGTQNNSVKHIVNGISAQQIEFNTLGRNTTCCACSVSSISKIEGESGSQNHVQHLDQEPVGNSVSSVRTIVITSGKGGVGKTTGTANLGMSIARLGYRVALIDADIGLRNLDLLLGLENRILYTAMDILEGQCRLDQALIRDKRWKNLSLLSISKNRQRYNVTRKNMENLVKSIGLLGYQFVLIDCPAGIDVGFINAISPAQEALIVTTPEITAIRDADRVAGLLEANGIYNVKLLVNRVRPDMIQKNDMMSVRDVQEMLGIPLLGAIPEDNHVIISTNRGEPLVLKKKLTLSGIAFENAARRLIGKQDYFIDLSTPYKGVFQKVQELFFG